MRRGYSWRRRWREAEQDSSVRQTNAELFERLEQIPYEERRAETGYTLVVMDLILLATIIALLLVGTVMENNGTSWFDEDEEEDEEDLLNEYFHFLTMKRIYRSELNNVT